ncbi:MAG TPA: hypothetical protein VM425_20055 [Myxococcota bacterium]|nr:hypothetical protein [Myxococcota bacterium]
MSGRFALLVGLLIVAGSVHAKKLKLPGSVEVKVEKASRDVLVRAAALGNMQFFTSSQLIIRLYGFSVSGTCIPETHQVCGHHYVLLTSSFDEAPEIHAYDLGEVGEFVKITLTGKNDDKVRNLELTVQNWASSALKSNPRLARRARKVTLQIDEKQVELVE